MKLDYCAIGMRIKERRTKKEWSQEMLASTVGISNPHMSNIERGKTKVKSKLGNFDRYCKRSGYDIGRIDL